MKKFLLYLLRWQLSTPILALILFMLKDCNYLIATIVANLIGGIIFFWIDKWIFRDKKKKKEEELINRLNEIGEEYPVSLEELEKILKEKKEDV